MDNSNSLVEFYLGLYNALYHDVVGCHASVCKGDYERDLQEIEVRVHSEGFGFLTKTLPKLGKALDRALSTGDKLQFEGFKKKPQTELPAFCWWLISLVFDDTGRERSDACPMALKQLRQLMFVLYKLELPYDDATAQKAIANFVKADEEARFNSASLSCFYNTVAQGAANIISRVLCGLDPREINPRHGPGAVATGESSDQKRIFSRLVRTIELVYPFTEYFCFNLSHVADRVSELQSLESIEAGTAKVVLVPKDSRGPRIISCEPLENQWIQQGQMLALVQHLESHPLTRGKVNFTDQLVNRNLAMSGSRDGSLSTLDMKEASDRVSTELVEYLFPANWFEALYASRSQATTLPDGTVLPLNKFAPMGSAICFPVEALVFWALCVSVVMNTRNIPLTRAASICYVYGDDIICDSVDQAIIRQCLPEFGLLVNEDKCCTHGFFRESCGCDAYKGVDVTPTKLSSVWCHHLGPETYESHVEYSNSLYDHGYFECSRYLEDRINSIRRTPYSGEPTSGICFIRAHVIPRIKNQELGLKTRFHKRKSEHQVLGWRSVASHKVTPSDDWEELLRVTSAKGNSNHLEHIQKVDDLVKLSIYERAVKNRDNVSFQDVGELPMTVVKTALAANKPIDGLFAQPPLVEARVYALPRRNRLQRGWIAIR